MFFIKILFKEISIYFFFQKFKYIFPNYGPWAGSLLFDLLHFMVTSSDYIFWLNFVIAMFDIEMLASVGLAIPQQFLKVYLYMP